MNCVNVMPGQNLSLVLAAAPATTEPTCVASFDDTTTNASGNSCVTLTGMTAGIVVPGPVAPATGRHVWSLFVVNLDTGPITVIGSLGGATIFQITIPAGGTRDLIQTAVGPQGDTGATGLTGGAASRWNALGTGTDYTAIPASTSTLTMLTDQTATIKPGMPVKFGIGGSTYYAQVTAITSSLLTIRGSSFSGTLTALSWGNPELCQLVTLNVEGAWTATATQLAAAEGHAIAFDMQKAHLVGFKAAVGTADTGAAQPYLQLAINGSLVGNAVQVSATPLTWTDAGVWSGDVAIIYGQSTDIQCPTLGTNHTAAKANAQAVYCLE
jgi:hypothetical protein